MALSASSHNKLNRLFGSKRSESPTKSAGLRSTSWKSDRILKQMHLIAADIVPLHIANLWLKASGMELTPLRNNETLSTSEDRRILQLRILQEIESTGSECYLGNRYV
jgi:hypothetical protein